MLKLYDYWRSSAAYRVRIALNLKGLAYEAIPIDLMKEGGEQHTPTYRAVNPQGLVPALDADGRIITQSLAIIEYLEETHPKPPLLPRDPIARGQVRAMALAIVAETHAIQTPRLGNYLRKVLKQPAEAVADWNRYWIEEGLRVFQELVERAPGGGPYCYGDTVTLADLVLAPQMANLRRFKGSTAGLERLVAIDKRLTALPAFQKAAPENHPLAEK
jgi:maleylacetoacetate isomerase